MTFIVKHTQVHVQELNQIDDKFEGVTEDEDEDNDNQSHGHGQVPPAPLAHC